MKERPVLFWGLFGVFIAAVTLGLLFFLSLALDSFAMPSDTIQATEVFHGREERIPELPVRLVIPSIDINAEVQYVGLDPNGTGEMGVPSNFTDVGWYKHGVRPGMRGSAVIAGHFNGKEIPEAVFYDLDMLEIGDEVIVMSEQRVEDVFRVVRIETYDYDEPTTDVFVSTDGGVRLNLITCGGEWLSEERSYDKRTVVFTELVTDDG